MANKEIMSKLANIPLAQPGFDALGISAPVMVQMNPKGQWENTKPGNLDEERLKQIVQYLVSTKALSAAQSYCTQCSEENQKGLSVSEKSNYVPIIMMPLSSADDCPFDMKCEMNKIKETKPGKKVTKKTDAPKATEKDAEAAEKKKMKKRGFVMQRLTDFDLLSQW